jgi:hypothetical protein
MEKKEIEFEFEHAIKITSRNQVKDAGSDVIATVFKYRSMLVSNWQGTKRNSVFKLLIGGI